MENILQFLEIDNVNDLRRERESLSQLTDDDYFVINNVIEKWDDRQAIANILLFPDIIEKSDRWNTIQKGLESYSEPYYILTAVCGIKRVKSNIPSQYREKYIAQLLRFCDTKTQTLAIQSSITLTHLLHQDEHYLLPQAYPVFNDIVNDNILVFLVENYDEKQLKQLLKNAKISWRAKRQFTKEFSNAKKHKKKLSFTEIPNLKDT